MKQKQISAYALLVILVTASAAIEATFNPLHVGGLSRLLAASLTALGVIVVIGHSYLSAIVIDIPAGVYNVLTSVNGFLVTLVGAAAILTQWFQANAPGFTPWVVFALQLATLISSLLAQVLRLQVAKLAARSAVAHG